MLSEIGNLGERIDLIDSNLKFNITVFLSLMTIFLAISGWALYIWARSIVEKSTQDKLLQIKEELVKEVTYEIDPIKNEVFELRGQLDQRILQIVEDNSKIKWASGSVYNDGSEIIYIGSLAGKIDWDSPITNIKVTTGPNKDVIPFDILDKGENNFTLKLMGKGSSNILNWTIVWYDKSL